MPLQHCATPAEAANFLRARVRGALRGDSRQLAAGDGFVAWPGSTQDARRFVGAALQQGAAACLVEREGVEAFGLDDPRIATLHALKSGAGHVADLFYGQPSAQLDVVATTGTNGKTSTTCWVAQALALTGRRCGVIGTLGVGVPGGPMQDTGLTTPDPVRLHHALRGFVDDGLAACAIEASSIGIVEQRLAGVRIAVAAFTNFTRDHLDFHGTMEAYWAAKRQLFGWPGLRAAVLNVDDEVGASLADELRGAGLELWTCSLRGTARLAARGLRHTDEGLAFEVLEGAQAAPVHAALIGEFNVANLLVVLGALRALGVPLADAAAVLPALRPVPGRLQPVGEATPTLARVLVDYAHTPDALDKVLHALRPLAHARGGRLWCVFGCGGNRDATKRPMMGAIAARLADRVVLTSDNPRDEAPGFILAQILAGVAGHDSVDVIVDRAEAIWHAVRSAAPADVVLLAGKGHEAYQEVAGERRPFADVEVAARALQACGPGAGT